MKKKQYKTESILDNIGVITTLRELPTVEQRQEAIKAMQKVWYFDPMTQIPGYADIINEQKSYRYSTTLRIRRYISNKKKDIQKRIADFKQINKLNRVIEKFDKGAIAAYDEDCKNKLRKTLGLKVPETFTQCVIEELGLKRHL